MKKKDKKKRNVLGMGLDALLPDLASVDTNSMTFFHCDVENIRPNRFQPRKYFAEDELDELAESIRKQGIIQPLVVRPDDSSYELVAGERRLRAAVLAGLEQVPVIVVDVADEEMLQMTIVENIQREDLNPMEECEGYHRLISEFALTQEQVSSRVGKKRSTVANFLRLKNLPQQIQKSLRGGEVSMGHARALLGIDNRAKQILAWKTVVAKGLSVRATEELAEILKNGVQKKPAKKLSQAEIYLGRLAEDLSHHLGTKVQISKKGKKGKLTIEFYADDDLERIMELLKN